MTKILVIENEEAIRENILELLEIEEFETLQAPNGKIGLEVAKEHHPDLILCDVMMPELDGYGVLEALRKQEETERIPFIFLTAKADKLDLRKGMELGADDYLTKPFSPDELLKAIATRLEKHAAVQKYSQHQLDELRSNITHSLPHELRTPLNGILASTELLLEDLNEMEANEIRELIEQIHISGKRLYRLTMNFLLYAELELIATEPQRVAALRQMKTASTQVALTQPIIDQVTQAQRKDDLSIQIEEAAVAIAEHQLRKIAEELVDNALKFSTPGKTLEIKGNIKENYFLFSIRSLGRGMTPEQIAHIGAHIQFQRKLYEQQGSGLGLALIEKLVALHQGQLIIESPSSQETLVTVCLPLSVISNQ